MLKAVGHKHSRALRVLWMLEELDEAYEYIPAQPATDDARAYNPSGKVPVLVDGETVITDSTAILTYLADKAGRFTATPGTLARAQQDAVTQRILDEMDAMLWMAAKHSFVLPKEHRVPELKQSLIWDFQRSCTGMSEILGDQPFIMGKTFTLPDIILTACLDWAIAAKFPVGPENLVTYRSRMKARPAHLAAKAL